MAIAVRFIIVVMSVFLIGYFLLAAHRPEMAEAAGDTMVDNLPDSIVEPDEQPAPEDPIPSPDESQPEDGE